MHYEDTEHEILALREAIDALRVPEHGTTLSWRKVAAKIDEMMRERWAGIVPDGFELGFGHVYNAYQGASITPPLRLLFGLPVRKGDTVLVLSQTVAEWSDIEGGEVLYAPHSAGDTSPSDIKRLIRVPLPEPQEGIAVGRSFVVSGIRDGERFTSRTQHEVWRVEPLDGEEYRLPWTVTAQDIAPVL